MRQVCYDVFTIDEHPQPELCYDWIRNNWYDLGQHYIEDMVSSLKALAKETGGKLDYSISIVPDRGEYVRISNPDAFSLSELYRRRGDCPLTGMCYDQDVIEGLYNDDLDYRVLSLLHAEGEYVYSDEALHEMCIANEYEFYTSGKVL